LDNGSHSVLSIEINKNGYIYVGKNGSDRFVVSKDNGNTWEEIVLPVPSYGNVIKILCIAQDTIYVSTWENEGSFITYSFDGGDTWEYSYVTDHSNEYISDIDVSSTGEVFVSTSGFFWDQGGVYKSADGGATWTYVGLLNHQVMTLEINSNDEVFTGDWWIINNDTPGIHALYEGTNTFDLIFDSYFDTDIVIDTQDNIYITASENVFYSIDNGQYFYRIEDTLSNFMQFLIIDNNSYLYAARSKSIVRSLDPLITVIDDSHSVKLIENVEAYPNPVCTNLYLKIESKPKHTSFYEVFIYDIYGKLIYINENTFFGDYYQLDVSQLARGLYLIKIQQNRELFKTWFIKK
jgi:hypothetical protein